MLLKLPTLKFPKKAEKFSEEFDIMLRKAPINRKVSENIRKDVKAYFDNSEIKMEQFQLRIEKEEILTILEVMLTFASDILSASKNIMIQGNNTISALITEEPIWVVVRHEKDIIVLVS